MRELYGQKQVPDVIIEDVILDCLTDFDLYFNSEECIEITCTSRVLPINAKKLFLSNGALGRKMQIIEPTRRSSDGADVDIPLVVTIKYYTLNYALRSDGEVAEYYFTFKCEYHG